MDTGPKKNLSTQKNYKFHLMRTNCGSHMQCMVPMSLQAQRVLYFSALLCYSSIKAVFSEQDNSRLPNSILFYHSYYVKIVQVVSE